MDRVCPLLALADRRTVVDGIDPNHACHALDEPMPLDRQYQAQLCLTPRHDRCERYLKHVAQRGGTPGRVALADGLVSTRLVLAPEPVWRGIAGRARRGGRGRAIAVGGAVLLTSVAGAVLARPAMDGSLSVLDAVAAVTPSPTPTPVAEASAAPLPPSLTPTALPSPSPSPTPSPTVTPAPAPTPTATPTPLLTYVVQGGDTLADIAERFGSTVAAIQAANDIEDPNEIIIGQTLVIP